MDIKFRVWPILKNFVDIKFRGIGQKLQNRKRFCPRKFLPLLNLFEKVDKMVLHFNFWDESIFSCETPVIIENQYFCYHLFISDWIRAHWIRPEKIYFLSPGTCHISKMELLERVVNSWKSFTFFRKNHHLRCLTGFWIHLWHPWK